MEKVQEEFDIDRRWRAFLLRPSGSPPMPAHKQKFVETEFERVRTMARQQYGIEINPGPIGIDSYSAHVATKYAQARGKGNAFHSAVMNAYWLEAQSIEEKTRLETIANQVGLDGSDLARSWNDPSLSAAVSNEKRVAERYDLHAVPALVIAGEYLISGAQPLELLKEAVARAQHEQFLKGGG